MDLLTQVLGALVIVLAIALYNRTNNPSSNSQSQSDPLSNSKKINKKKKKTSTKSISAEAASTSAFLESDASAQTPIGRTSKEKEQSTTTTSSKKSKSKAKSSTILPKDISQNLQASASGVEERGLPSAPPTQAAPSMASSNQKSTDSEVGTSSKTNQERREEMDAKKVGRGEERVNDMVDRDIQPETTYDRVARIPGPEIQTNGSSAPEYEEWEELPIEDQGGWESVGQGSKSSRLQTIPQPSNRPNGSSNGAQGFASSNPFSALPDGADSSWASVGRNGVSKTLKVPAGTGAVKSLNGNSNGIKNGGGSSQRAQQVATSEPTKKQRQNAAKAAAKKQARDAEEKDRLDRLAKHKKEVEGQRIKEFYTKGVGSNGKNGQSSSGPKASVNENGALVWD